MPDTLGLVVYEAEVCVSRSAENTARLTINPPTASTTTVASAPSTIATVEPPEAGRRGGIEPYVAGGGNTPRAGGIGYPAHAIGAPARGLTGTEPGRQPGGGPCIGILAGPGRGGSGGGIGRPYGYGGYGGGGGMRPPLSRDTWQNSAQHNGAHLLLAPWERNLV